MVRGIFLFHLHADGVHMKKNTQKKNAQLKPIEHYPRGAVLDETEELTVAQWERIKKGATVIEAQDGPFLLVYSSRDDVTPIMHQVRASMNDDAEIVIDLEPVGEIDD
jgi:hypothetical protein